MKRSVLTLSLWILASSAYAQSIDWIHRIPLLQTGWQYPGEAQVIEDSTRNRLMTVGWRLGTVFRSEDKGSTWQGQYAIGTDVVGKYGSIYVAPDGRYIWHGETPWNQRVALVSTDGGVEWRTYTRDTLVYKDGSHRGLQLIIPPYNIRAYDHATRSGYVLSSDLGATWRKVHRAPSDTMAPQDSPEVIAAPNILYFRGSPYLYRFDARTDTVWTQTRVDGRGRRTIEVDGGVVSTVANTLRVYPSWSDTTHRAVRTWKDDVTGEEVALSIGDVRRFDDSTVYAYDDRGWIFEVRPRTMDVRCIRPFGAAFPVPASGIMLRPRFLWASTYREYGMSIVEILGLGWCVAELKNGSVYRVDTVAERSPAVIVNGQFPLNYYGERGIFMFKISTGSFREIVRTTDLGASWIHGTKVESEELEPTYLGARSSVRAPDGTLLVHTSRDHCVIPDERGSIERTHALTGIFGYISTWPRMMLFDRVPTLHRDGDRLLLPGRTLMEYDYKRGTTVSTVLPRKSSFVRRLTPDMLIAGADSLWLSFDNDSTWVYVSAPLTSKTPLVCGQFSDATRTTSGTLLAAVRGVDFKDVDERRGIVRYGGIGRSVDNGNTWQWVTNLPDSMRFVSRIERVNDSVVLAIAGRMLVDSAFIREQGSFKVEVNASAILISTNDGATWTIAAKDIRTGMPRGEHEPDICVLDNGIVLASMHAGVPYISTNSGRTWTLLDIPELGQATVFSFRRESNGDVMICTSNGAGYLRLPGVTTVAFTDEVSAEREHVWVFGEQLHVRVEHPQTRVRVVTMDGRCIADRVCDLGVSVFDIETYASGVYGVECTSATSTTRQTVVW
jgi:photosystem II stability/assembly factor-like uncharacterized protein